MRRVLLVSFVVFVLCWKEGFGVGEFGELDWTNFDLEEKGMEDEVMEDGEQDGDGNWTQKVELVEHERLWMVGGENAGNSSRRRHARGDAEKGDGVIG